MNDYVNIPRWLYVELVRYFVGDDKSTEQVIVNELMCKTERMLKRIEYENKINNRTKKQTPP